MNWNQVEGRWKEMKGAVRAKWGKLTDDDFDVIAGNKDKFVGKLQQLYGTKREDLEAEIDQFMSARTEERNDKIRH
jgi:uncharacterized protein YjbJ (UPF0337 family)